MAAFNGASGGRKTQDRVKNKFDNELPRGKPRSIGAKTTGVARNEA
jgi:hypothetical protein